MSSVLPDRRAVLAGLAATPFAGAALAQAGSGDAALKAVLDDLEARRPSPADALTAVRAIDQRSLSPRWRLEWNAVCNGAVLASQLERLFPWSRAADGPSPYPVTARTGAFLRLGRKGDVSAEITAETARIRDLAAQGIVPPRSTLDWTLKALTAVHGPKALADQIETLEALKTSAPLSPGVGRLKNGVEWYASALAINLGEEIDPEKVHDVALGEIATLQAEADRLLHRRGMKRGSVAQRLRALARDPKRLYPDTDAGRDRAVADMNARLDRARSALPRMVLDVPPAVNAVSVLRMSPEDAAKGRAGYRDAPPYDGSRKGGYYVDLREIRKRPDWTLPSVVHHELLPGHLLQLPLQERARPHPYRLRWCAAWSEAWGIYAEQMADEAGLFHGDDWGRLGYLQWRLFRVGRLLADTGIHTKRWSRETAIRQLLEIHAFPSAFITVEEDVERIIAAPGQAGAQAIGALRFKTFEALGDPRTIRTNLLGAGPLPFSVAEAVAKGAYR